jgi:hypothetical protein
MTMLRPVRDTSCLSPNCTLLIIHIIDAAENFAQEVIVALFDKVVPGGIGSVSPNWNSIFHQYATVQSKLGDILIPGGTCNRKFADE